MNPKLQNDWRLTISVFAEEYWACGTHLYLNDCFKKAQISQILCTVGNKNVHRIAQKAKNVQLKGFFGALSTVWRRFVFPHCYRRKNVNMLQQHRTEITVKCETVACWKAV